MASIASWVCWPGIEQPADLSADQQQLIVVAGKDPAGRVQVAVVDVRQRNGPRSRRRIEPQEPNRKISALAAMINAANAITGATVNKVSEAPTIAPPIMVATTP